MPPLQANSQRIKAKSVNYYLNDAIRARLCETRADYKNPVGNKSGSDNGIDMSFLEEEDGGCLPQCRTKADGSEGGFTIPILADWLAIVVKGISSSSDNKNLEAILLRDVIKATEKADISTEMESQGKSYVRRFVMKNLRCAGYDACICRSRWKQVNNYPAGHYEYIDVSTEAPSLNHNSNDRLMVDIDFRSQFEIARPSAEYSALLQILPSCFVGRADQLRAMIKIMCDAAKISLKAEGLHLPPWRKYRYVEAKWLGPSTHPLPPMC
ncbi:hypothetical protein SUGI_0335410 [Cryptomeria japonica]|uniref:uncharacterized protein LOC131036774 n=1 Tax=Cryptomeria japonica TaxID=3369 RepID=UPI002408EC37|nr:uncharacterized protein LOC131036774 [Cryptomeria japonica]GLJ18786.1 hypothetical protein SUGI_0335410 [Cryptomeria japonica]